MSIVEIDSGRVEGLSEPGVEVFYGIPFAAPTGRAHRFQPPRPPAPWAGVRDATARGFAAPQPISPMPGVSADGPQDEDCLNLNIFTPRAGAGRRPVMVWIHGGAYLNGAAYQPLYDGRRPAMRGDVVVVTINYRLGALGFLYLGAHLPGADVAANLGLLDQIEALRWVRRNIARFGGDPDNVTIFGESAGGGSVHALTAMPAAKGLFGRAIVQSGVAHTQTLEDGARVADRMLDALGIAKSDAARLLETPVADIVAAQSSIATFGGGLAFMPLIDPASLPVQSVAAIAAGAGREVDMLIGSNLDEHKFFVFPGRPQPDEAALLDAFAGALPKASRDNARALTETYRASRGARGLPADNNDLLDALFSDISFHSFARAVGAAQSAHRRTWSYLFTHRSPAMRGALGACHALELGFVFGTARDPAQYPFTGTGPAVERLSDLMMDAWIAFARAGDPNHADLPDWAPYGADRRATMIFDTPCGVEDDPFGEERRAVAALI
jgi:para-nitrobenzyl esterase